MAARTPAGRAALVPAYRALQQPRGDALTAMMRAAQSQRQASSSSSQGAGEKPRRRRDGERMSPEEEAEQEPTTGGVAMAIGAMGMGALGAVGLSVLGIAGALYGASFAAATLGTWSALFPAPHSPPPPPVRMTTLTPCAVPARSRAVGQATR